MKQLNLFIAALAVVSLFCTTRCTHTPPKKVPEQSASAIFTALKKRIDSAETAARINAVRYNAALNTPDKRPKTFILYEVNPETKILEPRTITIQNKQKK